MISVIVPVYNAGKYLEQCIESIVRQKIADFEIILINDGSTDRSGEICDKYVCLDERVRVFHQQNAGVSNARNVGIKAAVGEWITFIDSDDYITENYFNSITDNLNADWILVNISRDLNSEIHEHLKLVDRRYEKTSFIKDFFLYPHFPGPWAKFFKRDIIINNKLQFNPDLKFGEDALFNLQYLNLCKIIQTNTKTTYIYRDTENGLSQLHFDIKNDRLLYHEIKKALKDYKGTEFYKKSLHFPLSRMIRILYFDKSLTSSQRRSHLKELVEENYEIILGIYVNPKIRPLFYIAHKTGSYYSLNYTLSKLHK
ncbi:glycosyltransferase family 2 protein [Kaistella palustris]|uniref:glycosyltransferase family 2 protein n=1 Tax=Kaistella palustris TaxID=493376 RepID=UPI00041DE22D|nr:glycosyltransferase [Kaistella palustris]